MLRNCLLCLAFSVLVFAGSASAQELEPQKDATLFVSLEAGAYLSGGERVEFYFSHTIFEDNDCRRGRQDSDGFIVSLPRSDAEVLTQTYSPNCGRIALDLIRIINFGAMAGRDARVISLHIHAFESGTRISIWVEAWWAGLLKMTLPRFLAALEHETGMRVQYVALPEPK